MKNLPEREYLCARSSLPVGLEKRHCRQRNSPLAARAIANKLLVNFIKAQIDSLTLAARLNHSMLPNLNDFISRIIGGEI